MKATNSRKTWRPLFETPDARSAVQRCDHPGCAEDGEYRAPRSRDRLNEYYWFCLSHVREYNSAWNYYAGMGADEIEAELRQDSTWQRPTWPLGMQGNKRKFTFTVHDPFDVYEGAVHEEARAKPRTPEEDALKVLELKPPVSAQSLKARYKELVKRHHPDANNGDKGAEERFKRINQAYNTLKNSLSA
ncbi:DnaJ-class molecular chaperone [Candidatus Terasakiella magnetica]|nr:DnaJ-class molecular chaperone [Candidatus Terasakiella magnetica]